MCLYFFSEEDEDEAHWSLEHGYPSENVSYPKRGTAPGISAGLTVLLDVQLHEYFMPRSGSIGFKV